MASPVYSLNRSRLQRSQTRNNSIDGQGPRRVSSGPTGMYTEHIRWARSNTDNSGKRASKTKLTGLPGPSKELLKQRSSLNSGANYPVLAWSE